MSSVYALTTRPLSPERKEQLYQALQDALGKTFRVFSMMYDTLAANQCRGAARNHVLVYVCVPPYMEVARRETLVADLRAAMVAVFGPDAEKDVDVLFPNHSDENCGVHGVMRCDAIAAQQGGSHA